MNVPEAELIPMALGHKQWRIKLRWKPTSTGDTRVAKEGLPVEMRTLDSFGIKPDFIKIDVEGWEMNVLKGAEETLKHKPVICVEQKPNKGQEYGWKETEAKDFLKSKGYQLRRIMAGDFILS